MRYLLLSVLVVCVIGVMVPSVFAEESCYAGPLGNIVKYGMDPNTPICPPDIQIDDRVTEIRTDQGTYQYGETVNFTVEIFGEGFGDGYHDLKFMISEQGNQTVEDVRIRVGEQKTFQFEPENYTWTQEYQVSSAGQLGLGTGWNTKTSFNVLPAGGCGEGTVLVDGACQLAPTQSKTTSMSIEPLYIIIGVVAIGGIIGAIAVTKRGSKTPKPTAKPKPVKQKPVEKKETSSSCSNCGNSLKKTAKFCGSCGTKV